MIELAARIHAEHGVHVEELDLGGGFGIAYTPDDDPPDVKSLTSSLRSIVLLQCTAFGLPVPRLTIGRTGHRRARHSDAVRGWHH